MKINEVIVEALNKATGTPNPDYQNDEVHVDPKTGQADFSGIKQAWQGAKMLGRGAASLPGRIKGAVAGYQASQQQRAATTGPAAQASKELAGRELQNWQSFLNQYIAGTGGKLTPQAVQAAATQFTARRYASAGPAVLAKVNAVKDVKSANDFITQAFNMAVANQKTGIVPGRASATDATQPPTQTTPGGAKTTPSGIEVPLSVGGGARKEQPSIEPEQDLKQQALAQGIKVVSQEPIILRTKGGKEYGLNDSGQWTHLASGKIPAEAYQQFLNQQHDISMDLG